ncbi:hypothetical protein BOTBODRAFT_634205 [Botryobasidium botryosum FD-172 SS1]|uniref:Phosphoglycerate mutase-like protein n=1 Tax=Botryobasidium botryosum (strain FD-172 SS1) TaxID=930990 RepID=A0A067M9H8_BOTB1|nr:hypothetical protein BOTBODRAFT_634205 [Botryobasidium botryosum FD-172 SS1]
MASADCDKLPSYYANVKGELAVLSHCPENRRQVSPLEPPPSRRPSTFYILLSFAAGVFACLQVQYISSQLYPQDSRSSLNASGQRGGTTEVHAYPPPSPTNAFPSLFPTDVGYPGPIQTGAEPAAIATAPLYALHTGAPHLVVEPSLQHESIKHGKGKDKFDMFKSWGNLSPWYSVPSQNFGLDTTPNPPEGCKVTGLHFLHRHGARYPTSDKHDGPAILAGRLHNATVEGRPWTATGALEFLNDWTFKLGGELLTPFGRQQLFDLGVSMRIKYGFLLETFNDTLPVFRTESQDRMLYTALNFAIGFFGYPIEDQYLQSITIEAPGFNNTLAPYMTCPNTGDPKKEKREEVYLQEWIEVYLAPALARLAPQLKGFDLTHRDIFTLQQLCAYETVAIGYSKFCGLFTEEEWEGFGYAWDIYFWYHSAFGAPLARVQGIGYVQELVSRLTHTPIKTHSTTTNGTLNDDPITFPLNNALYVDATHEVVILNIITALNLTNFAASGPLPTTHIPSNLSFKSSELCPFASNIQFQLLSCASTPDPQIRIIINDGVTPLTGIEGCPEQKDGMCPVDTFVAAQQRIIEETDWHWGCYGDWSVPPGAAWNTTTGDPPKKD